MADYLRKLISKIEENPRKWSGLPYEAVVLYTSSMVEEPEDIRYFISRHIPPEKAGNIVLGIETE